MFLLLSRVELVELFAVDGEAVLHLLGVGGQEGQGGGVLFILHPPPAHQLQPVDLAVDPATEALFDGNLEVFMVLFHVAE